MGPTKGSYARLLLMLGGSFVATFVYGYDARELSANPDFGDWEVAKASGCTSYIDPYTGKEVVPTNAEAKLFKRFWNAITSMPDGPVIQYFKSGRRPWSDPELWDNTKLKRTPRDQLVTPPQDVHRIETVVPTSRK